MKKTRFSAVYLLPLIALLLLSACASDGPDISYKELLKKNKADLPQLSLGMTRDQVMAVMKPYTSSVHEGTLSNPYRSDWVQQGKDAYEIMYFLTYRHPPFTPILTSQATPVVLKNGIVAGLGANALQALKLPQR